MRNLDVGALQAVFEVLQQHYPECLGELWFLNAPFIFWGLWRVVSPFIQQATKEKIKFLSGRDWEQLLQQYIPQNVSLFGFQPNLAKISMLEESATNLTAVLPLVIPCRQADVTPPSIR